MSTITKPRVRVRVQIPEYEYEYLILKFVEYEYEYKAKSTSTSTENCTRIRTRVRVRTRVLQVWCILMSIFSTFSMLATWFSVHGIHPLFMRKHWKGERGLVLSSELQFTNIMTKCFNSFVQDCSLAKTLHSKKDGQLSVGQFDFPVELVKLLPRVW